MELPPVPEAGDSDSGSEEERRNWKHLLEDGLLPPPPSMEDPSAPEIPSLPPVPEMGLPPVLERGIGFWIGRGNGGAGVSSEGEGLLPPPPSMEELSAPETSHFATVPEMGLPPSL